MTADKDISSPERPRKRERPLSRCNATALLMRRSLVLHHAAHVHVLIARRNCEKTVGLRSLLDVAQLAAAALTLPFHDKLQLRVNPYITRVAVRGCAFVFDRIAAVHHLVAHLVASSTRLARELLPVAAGILDIRWPEEGERALRGWTRCTPAVQGPGCPWSGSRNL